jgi:hypothetical protein
MLAINESIGRFVALANLEKDIFSQKSIEQNVADLVDLITMRVKDKPVDEVAHSLLENTFNLRLEVIEWFIHQDKGLNFYLESLIKHIAVNLQLSPYSNLAEAISSVLSAYEKIVSPKILESISLEDIFHGTQENKPVYNTFKILSFHPSPQIKYLKNWLDSSLKLEVGIILADLILTNQINFPKKRIKSELIEFLYSTVTKFGAYSIFTGFWCPELKDTSNLTNRMKILSATLELENKSLYKISKEGLFKMVNN